MYMETTASVYCHDNINLVKSLLESNLLFMYFVQLCQK